MYIYMYLSIYLDLYLSIYLQAPGSGWPLHDVAITNIVWCMAYKRGRATHRPTRTCPGRWGLQGSEGWLRVRVNPVLPQAVIHTEG